MARNTTKKKEEMFNGRPMSYWVRQADELVVDCLVRSAGNLDHRSIIGKMASERLTYLAKAMSPEIYNTTVEQNERMQVNLATILNSMIGADPPKRKKKEER